MKRSPLLLLLLFLFISCMPSQAEQAEQTSTQETPGLDTEKLARIGQVIETEIEEGRIAGATALIKQNGEVALKDAWGWQDMEEERPMETGHLFRIASMTKAITSAAILQMFERGELDLNDPLENFIPEFANPRVLTEFDEETGTVETRPADRSITIHDLLTHTSGIAYGFNNDTFRVLYGEAGIPDLGTENELTIGEAMASLGELPLAHDPGERYTYGLNTDVLGRVVEVVSGLSLAEYFQENIFDPLAMNNTGFYLPGRGDDLTTLYTTVDGELIPTPNEEDQIITPNFPVQGAMTYYSGGAGLTSTVYDYTRFLQALLNGGELDGSRILEEQTWQLMSSNQIGDLSLSSNRFGYGLMIITPEGAEEGKRSVGSLSWGGIFQTTYWIDPDKEMTVVMFTQVYPSPSQRDFYDRFERAVYSAIAE
jgi:CubicO group peptidase (beta-lactamase class C family)